MIHPQLLALHGAVQPFDEYWKFVERVDQPRTPHGIALVCSARFAPGGEQETRARLTHAERLGLPIFAPTEPHTKAELQAALRLAMGDLTIVTSGYHMPRALLTAIGLLTDPWALKLWTVPVPWDVDRDTQQAEAGKLAHYQAVGEIASCAKGLAYLDWRDGA